ncbi:MAG: hypothetical protein H7842_03290 [Gammaproteobacteria bacterium SHHR-1]|uniref:hypothetical protein n=1 Tax=Magnetovirga frankeli TaxID=947516 RepID=UPI00129369CE|nr:hypothetical protein D5125_09930 [gamma proteobacterium SS-5]
MIFFSFLLLLVLVEPVWANRLNTIGSGVSGVGIDKAKLLKFASLGLGGLFVLLGLLSMFPMFRGHSNLKSPEVNLKISGALVAFGGILISLYFFA